MIDLTFLGTGAMMPTSRRWLSSFLMRVDGRLILFDVGEGSQIPWQQSGWGFKRLDTICLSHWHADHVAGLPGVLHALAHAGREEPVTIIGPKGTRAMAHALRELAPELPYPLAVADLVDGQSWQIGPLTASVRLGAHRVPVLAYRFDLPRAPAFLADRAEGLEIPRDRWAELARGGEISVNGSTYRGADFTGPPRRGLSVGVMTDTRPFPAAADHLAEVDLLIADGTYGDPADGEKAVAHMHMTFADAAGVARDAGARRLILTHFSPKMEDPSIWLEGARSIFPATELAVPRETITLNYEDLETATEGQPATAT